MANKLVQQEKEEARRHILRVLYDVGAAIRAKRVRHILSDMGLCSLLWREFVENLEFLAGEELIRIFAAGTKGELTNVDQAKYLSTVRRMQFDDPECDTVMIRIRQKGRHFIEGNDDGVKGVARD